MAEQTAVYWLVEQLPLIQQEGLRDIIEQAKELEKQQHGNTWDAAIKAHDDRGHVHARSLVDFDEYYEETF
jgi:hypothetical protein